MLFNSIKSCDVDVRMELYGNIVLAGGNTMFKGMAARVTKELVALAPPQMKVKVSFLPSVSRRFGSVVPLLRCRPRSDRDGSQKLSTTKWGPRLSTENVWRDVEVEEHPKHN